MLQKEAAHLSVLTPKIIRQAEDVNVVDNHEDVDGYGESLQLLSHQWAGHVRSLIEASQQVNMPWSKTAHRLVRSAKTRKGLEREVTNIVYGTFKLLYCLDYSHQLSN